MTVKSYGGVTDEKENVPSAAVVVDEAPTMTVAPPYPAPFWSTTLPATPTGTATGNRLADALPVAAPMVAMIRNGVDAPTLAAGVKVPAVPVPEIVPAVVGSTDQATAFPSGSVASVKSTAAPPAWTDGG